MAKGRPGRFGEGPKWAILGYSKFLETSGFYKGATIDAQGRSSSKAGTPRASLIRETLSRERFVSARSTADEGSVHLRAVCQLLLADAQCLAASADVAREDAPELGWGSRCHAEQGRAKHFLHLQRLHSILRSLSIRSNIKPIGPAVLMRSSLLKSLR